MKEIKRCFSIILMLLLVLLTVSQYHTTEVFAEEYIPIYTADDLFNINNGLDKNYILMNDIDLTEETTGDGTYNFNMCGWKPIGGNSLYQSTEFTGTFDGNNHTIYGMRIEIENTSMLSGRRDFGLFGKNAGTIKNLDLVDGIIIAKNIRVYSGCFGGICGYNSGEIIHCCCKNNIDIENMYNTTNQGITSYVGGITGYNANAISLSSNFGTIKSVACGFRNTESARESKTEVGGISGILYPGSEIRKCFNSGNIYAVGCTVGTYKEGYAYASGISSGLAAEGLISDCYNSGEILQIVDERAHNDLIRAGITIKSQVEKSYSLDATLSDNAIKAANTQCSDCFYLQGGQATIRSGTTPLTNPLMKKQKSYTNFDFTNTWVLSSDSYYKYPQIRGNRQDDKVAKIELKSAPNKTNYIVGDEIDLSGSAITVMYLEGVSADAQITQDMISGYNKTEAGNYEVTVTYKGKTTSFNVSYTTSGGGSGSGDGGGTGTGTGGGSTGGNGGTAEDENYIVNFDLQGHGTLIPAVNVNKDSKLKAPTQPTEKGWIFIGWYKEKECKNMWNFGLDKVTSNTTLYAKWIKNNIKTTSIKSLKSGKKSFTITVKKLSKTDSNGYQLRYSIYKNMKKSAVKTIGTKYTAVNKKITKLKSKKKYYVQVRTIKKIEGQKCYSAWSKIKTVKTK